MITVTTSVVATVLLDGTLITHSVFKIPVSSGIESQWTISIESDLANLVRKIDFISWEKFSRARDLELIPSIACFVI